MGGNNSKNVGHAFHWKCSSASRIWIFSVTTQRDALLFSVDEENKRIRLAFDRSIRESFAIQRKVRMSTCCPFASAPSHTEQTSPAKFAHVSVSLLRQARSGPWRAAADPARRSGAPLRRADSTTGTPMAASASRLAAAREAPAPPGQLCAKPRVVATGALDRAVRQTQMSATSQTWPFQLLAPESNKWDCSPSEIAFVCFASPELLWVQINVQLAQNALRLESFWYHSICLSYVVPI